METNDRKETGKWKTQYRVTKYEGDFHSEAEAIAAHAKIKEVVKGEDNVLVNTGIAILLDKLIGAGSAQIFDNGHTRMGVGTSSTTAAATDTDLGANGVWKAMDATYPSRAGQVLTFQSTWASADANQAWNEWAIDNGSAAHVLLNHKAPVTLGTKLVGETWSLQVTVTES